MYAELVTILGWTWDQVDEMTLPRYWALLDFWKDHPPLLYSVNAYVGVGAKPADAEQEDLLGPLLGL